MKYESRKENPFSRKRPHALTEKVSHMNPLQEQGKGDQEQQKVLKLETGRQRKNEYLFMEKDKKIVPKNRNKKSEKNSNKKDVFSENIWDNKMPLIGTRSPEKKEASKMNRSNPKDASGEFKDKLLEMMRRDSEAVRDIMSMAEEVIQDKKKKPHHFSERNIDAMQFNPANHNKKNYKSEQPMISVPDDEDEVIQRILNKPFFAGISHPKKKEIKSMRGEISPVYRKSALSMFDSNNIKRIGSNQSFFGKENPNQIREWTFNGLIKKKIKSQSNFHTNNEKKEATHPEKHRNYTKSIIDLRENSKKKMWSKNELSPYFKKKIFQGMRKPNSILSFQDNREISSWSNKEDREDNLMESDSNNSRPFDEEISKVARASNESLKFFKNIQKGKSKKNIIFEKNSKEENFLISLDRNNDKDSLVKQNKEMMEIYHQNKNEINLLKNIVIKLQESKKEKDQGEANNLKKRVGDLEKQVETQETTIKDLQNERSKLREENQNQKEEIIKLNSQLKRAKDRIRHLKEMGRIYKKLSQDFQQNEYQLGNSYDINTLRSNIRNELSRQSSELGSRGGSRQEGSTESDWEHLLLEKKRNIEKIRNKREQIKKNSSPKSVEPNKFSWNPNLSRELNFNNKAKPMVNLYESVKKIDLKNICLKDTIKSKVEDPSEGQHSSPNNRTYNRIYHTNSRKKLTPQNQSQHKNSSFTKKQISIGKSNRKTPGKIRNASNQEQTKNSKRARKMIYHKLKGKLTHHDNISFNNTQPVSSGRHMPISQEHVRNRYTFNMNKTRPRQEVSINSNFESVNGENPNWSFKGSSKKYIKSSFISKKLAQKNAKLRPKYSPKNLTLHAPSNHHLDCNNQKTKIGKWFHTPKVKNMKRDVFDGNPDASPYQLNQTREESVRNSFNPSNYISLKSPKYSPIAFDSSQYISNRSQQAKKPKYPKYKSAKPKKVYIPQRLLRNPLNELNKQNYTKYFLKEPGKKRNTKNTLKHINLTSLTVGGPKKIVNNHKYGNRKLRKNNHVPHLDLQNKKKTSLFYKQHEQKKKKLNVS